MARRRHSHREGDRTRMTLLSRRDFVKIAAASSTGAALCTSSGPTWAREASVPLAASSLGDNLSLVTGGGGNIVAMGSADGALLVDGGSKVRSAAAIKLALRSVTAKKLHTLFNNALASRPDRRQ